MGNTVDLETQIWETEGIHVTIRAPKNTQFDDYPYQRAMAGNSSLHKLKTDRLEKVLNGYEYEIVDGALEIPHGRTRLSNVRESYDAEE